MANNMFNMFNNLGVNGKDDRGLTPLHQAAYLGELEILKSLLKSGADSSADNGKGWTPLHSIALSAGLPRQKLNTP